MNFIKLTWSDQPILVNTNEIKEVLPATKGCTIYFINQGGFYKVKESFGEVEGMLNVSRGTKGKKKKSEIKGKKVSTTVFDEFNEVDKEEGK